MNLPMLTRRQLLAYTSLSGLAWLTPVAEQLSRAAEKQPRGEPARSLILVWLSGGPSQLETFDPHPGRAIGGPTQAIDTRIKAVQIASTLPRVAEQLDACCLIRDVVSKEGDHERGALALKTGYPPEPTIVHPSVGAILCHQLPESGVEIPRHVSILPDRFPGKGGFLGAQFDAFKTYDPRDKVPDVQPRTSEERFARRLADQNVVEQAFAVGRVKQAEATLHREMIDRARRMMASEQLQAFELDREPQSVQTLYGDSTFGRGCLAARRLIEVGVRCVEVTLSGWDTHANNFEGTTEQNGKLDQPLAALLQDLRERKLLDHTVVMCCGEFGRTPKINGLDGRDHWPTGFSMLLAGGPLRRGHIRGATDPDGQRIKYDDGTRVADLHATVLRALGVNPALELQSPIGRPIKLSEGKLLVDLFAS
ncbi:MAG: DUF1501 domain-containing protein [Planctomycetaceae bacterium]|nr:DUF1501 domain-containing protein [Planctomycetaceae bacterium]